MKNENKDKKMSNDKTKYTNEEITSAITLVSIMNNEEQRSDEGHNVSDAKPAEDQTSGVPNVNQKKGNTNEANIGPNSYISTAVPQRSGFGFGNAYPVYPMDTFGYQQSYPFFPMQPNFGSTSGPIPMHHSYGPVPQISVNCESMPQMYGNCGPMTQMGPNYGSNPMAVHQNWRQCPYCLAPNAPIPPHPQYGNACPMPTEGTESSMSTNYSQQVIGGQIGGDVSAAQQKSTKEDLPAMKTEGSNKTFN